jgi:DNA-binding winged helix-turn-helix (wHTH) protein
VGKAQDLRFGDLILDETCLFASRHGQTVQFTRNERALLRALIHNPHRLMRRGRLLDEIASESEVSDRNIDFLVNRLRAKLGDNAKSPKYIATQYGEGYVWVATPSLAPRTDAFLVIGLAPRPPGYPSNQHTSSLVGQLRDTIAAGLGTNHRIVVAENWRPGATDRLCYFLQLSFRAADGRLDGAATLREMPARRIVRAFQLHLDTSDAASFTGEAGRIASGVLDVLRQGLAKASAGLGIATDVPLDIRLQRASALLSASNPQWLARGEQLSEERKRDPHNPDIALQWCMHLFARLTLTSPFGGMSTRQRDSLESEIEATALGLLPTVEGSPLLMLTCAKLLYFINRGYLDLAEDMTERACARTEDDVAALPIIGQLHYARGRFDEAVRTFDRGIAMAELGPALQLHLRVLKCLAHLAAGDRAALEAAALDLPAYLGPLCPPDLAMAINWTIAAPDRALPAELARSLVATGPVGGRNTIEYLYFTSARHLIPEQARANLMRGLIAHVARLHGEQAVPDFVLRSIGMIAAV